MLRFPSGRDRLRVDLIERMDGTPIVIVGAGPAGLVLALSLARYEIHVRCLRDFMTTLADLRSQAFWKKKLASAKTREGCTLLATP